MGWGGRVQKGSKVLVLSHWEVGIAKWGGSRDSLWEEGGKHGTGYIGMLCDYLREMLDMWFNQ